MHETADDLKRLQALLKESRAAAGKHMRSIFTKVTDMSVDEIVAELPGVQVLDLATVTAAAEPRVAPVDGLFYRGHFYFGTAHNAVRARHLRARPQVSAAHTRGEDLTIIVHGDAVDVDVSQPEHAGFRSYLLDVYPGWESWYPGAPPPYWRIEPARMFAARTSRLRPS